MGAMFSISKRASIPSDGQPHKVLIAVVDVQPTFEYVAIPRAAPRAYLTAKASNQSPYTLLAGMLQVYLDGSATTHTSLPLINPQENFTLSFGADQAVQVKQIPQVKKSSEEKGIFYGDHKKQTVVHAMSVKNTKETEVTVRVQDSLPEATHKDLKVTLQEKTTAGSNGAKVSFKQADAQQLEWEVTLPPGATQTLTAKFTIEWPKDKEVVPISGGRYFDHYQQ